MTLHRLKSLEFIRVYLAWKRHLTFSQTQMITTIECFLAGLIAAMVLGVKVLSVLWNRHFLLFYACCSLLGGMICWRQKVMRYWHAPKSHPFFEALLAKVLMGAGVLEGMVYFCCPLR
ncbi:hypothetical protein [Deinococcus roseus]|uniref:DUF565 domain-containing protein n=1 Tax=Deinococcus roseus TaxID=392414 RepID=A0ABQ2D3F1_9DEIO|nr:hypothetical protein [Deinococcus roseus]GGJ44392.1 hypothetical protein GCM10008938_33240 [Deinococcus roseus]